MLVCVCGGGGAQVAMSSIACSLSSLHQWAGVTGVCVCVFVCV